MKQIIDDFRELMHSLRSGEGAAWLSVDLTMPQIKALFVICTQGKMSGRELARALGVGPSAITPLVDRLVEHGLVRRQEDIHDRRITWTCLTGSGLSLVDQLQTTRREQLGKAIMRLSPEDCQVVARAIDLLRRAAEQDQLSVEVAADAEKD